MKSCCKSCKTGKSCDSKKKVHFEDEEDDHHHNETTCDRSQDDGSHYWEERGVDEIDNLREFKDRVEELRGKELNTYRPIDFYDYKRSLFEALVFPEIAKGVKLPSQFQIPTYVFQQKNSFTVTTNTNGNAYVQVNMGQFLDSSRFKTGAVGSQNGTSTVGNSNVFMTDSTTGTLTGVNPIANTAMIASNVMQVNTGTFNTVRPGPASVKIEYIGRLDIASGNLTMGLNYTSVADPANIASSVNGLYPDPTYSVLTALEDCPFARTVPITDSLKGIFIPHDYSMLNLRSATDASSVPMPQRLFILATAAPPNSTICRITITQNWEGVPTQQFSDLITLSYNAFPSNFDANEIYSYMIENNLVVSKNELEYGIFKHIEKK